MAWSEAETNLLIALRPWCSRKEIELIFKELGSKQTFGSIKSKAERTQAIGTFIELRVPDTSQFPPKVKAAVDKILTQRNKPQAFQFSRQEVSFKQTPVGPSAAKKILENILRDIEEQQLSKRSRYSTKTFPKKDETLCILLSDFHIGRVVEDQNGEVLYDIEVMQVRCRKLEENILAATSRHCKSINEVVFFLLGDFIDGEGVYPGQMSDLEANLSEQVCRATIALWNLISGISKKLDVPTRVITCRGNHGRSANRESSSNWDDVVYSYLNLLAESNPSKVSVSVTQRDHNVVQVKGHTILARHKAPVQADTSGARAVFAGWFAIHSYHSMVYAHNHHWGTFTWNGKPIFRNGSFIGPDKYSEQLAVHDIPAQLIFGLTPDELPTFLIPIKF